LMLQECQEAGLKRKAEGEAEEYKFINWIINNKL